MSLERFAGSPVERKVSTAAGLFIVLCALSCQLTAAHIQLSYPPPITVLDFLDNVRTSGLCGEEASGADNSAYWRLPSVSNTVTTLSTGEKLNATWNLHYAHQGGWRFELYDDELELVHTWNDSSHWACNHDGTQQWATITLPETPCEGCILRMQRQALEWGPTYLFHSCALVDIEDSSDDDAACNGCSGHGKCVKGKCRCDSNEKKGFWEGTYCERQNECDDDTHCGEGGVCVNIGATSPPRKQCYCKEGWFGDEIQPWLPKSKLPTRKCDRKSEMKLGDPSKWDEEYENKRTSPGTGAFTLYYEIDEEKEEIEFAIRATTTNWVGVGWRAASIQGVPPPNFAPTAPAAEGEPAAGGAEGEPAVGVAAEGEPAVGVAAEGEPAVGSEGEPVPESEAKDKDMSYELEKEMKEEEESAKNEKGRRLSEYPPDAEKEKGDYEGEAAPEGEAVAAEGEPATVAEGEPVAAGEGEPVAEGEPAAGGGNQFCAPGDPSIVTSDDGVAVGKASKKDKKKRGLLFSLPELEEEHIEIDFSMMAGRHMLEEGAASEAEAEAEPTTVDSRDPVFTFFGTKKCRNPLVDNPSAHPMINQDIVVGYAQGKTFRIQDSFTPSRARPLPDVFFGGQDDIIDAVGREEDGLTFLKFRRKLETNDTPGDYCISKKVNYLVIYAYGQPTDKLTHIPNSSLETGRASNKEFYAQDELKFHGGGIGTSYEGRGVLGQVDFFQEPIAEGCQPSALDGFDCMRVVIPDSYNLHWSLLNDGVKIAGEATGTGWVSVAWAKDANAMIGSTAVIGWTGDDGDFIGVHRLDEKSANAVVATEDEFEISDESIRQEGSRTILEFTRAFDDDFARQDTHDLLVAFHPTADKIEYHGPASKVGLALNFVTGLSSDSTEGVEGSGRNNLRNSNGGRVRDEELLSNSAGPGSCLVSNLAGFDCMQEATGGALLHWTVEDDGVRLAAEASGTGWVSVAFAETAGMMIPAQAVIGWTGSGEDHIGVYMLDGKSADQVVENGDLFEPEAAEIEETDGKTMLKFKRMFDGTFSAEDTHNLLVAFSPTADAIEYHGPGRGGLSLNFLTGASITVAGEDLSPYWIAHGILMIIGWGAMLPIGIIIARTMKDKDPLWFKLHVALQSLGLLVALSGFVMALWKFDRESTFRHRQVGITAMVFGLIQPLNAVIRPKHGERFREHWEWMHWTLGRAALILAVWNIFTGLDEYDFLQSVGSKKYHVAFGMWLMALFLAYLSAESRSQRIASNRMAERLKRLDIAVFRAEINPTEGDLRKRANATAPPPPPPTEE
ncbi:hypothetical protein BSKO_04133 [Bryopsis sp. KO-2023]|nr:hypothetical protein BSKO_04133 [Bryopsis sp. KO-2023]